jgi:hypothetical protein
MASGSERDERTIRIARADGVTRGVIDQAEDEPCLERERFDRDGAAQVDFG